MNLYLIQNNYDIDTAILKSLLRNSDNYEFINIKDLDSAKLSAQTIPIGDINFVNKAIKKFNPSFTDQVPIEIPTYLQKEEYLKRKYKIGTWEDIPKTGKWFIKDASKLKSFSMCTQLDYWYDEKYFDYKPKSRFDCTLSLSKKHDYIISSPVNIYSEYRVYVVNRHIVDISFYTGDPTILPDVDIIKNAVKEINKHEDYLKSYSLDIMVSDKGTAIIEVHNFSSLGLYTAIWDRNNDDLLLAYKQGIEYL